MKTLYMGLVVCAMSLGLLHAQPQIEARLTVNLQPSPTQFGEISEVDKKVVIQKVAVLLNQHVTFRNDGITASFYDAPSGRQYVEWQNLRIKMLVPSHLHAGDETKGISKRIQALLIFDACRMYNPRTNVWSPWDNRGHPLFPPAINVAWQNGHPIPDGGMHMPSFMPGPIVSQDTGKTQPSTPAPTTPTAPAAPSTGTPTQGTIQRPAGSGGLPPGMQRK